MWAGWARVVGRVPKNGAGGMITTEQTEVFLTTTAKAARTSNGCATLKPSPDTRQQVSEFDDHT
jgi:hypothetical protein